MPLPPALAPKREPPLTPPAFKYLSVPLTPRIKDVPLTPPTFEDLSVPRTPPAFEDLSDPLTPPALEDLPERRSLSPAFEEGLPKIPSADEILNGLAPMKSKQKYDTAWAEFLAFLHSPQYSTVYNKCQPGKQHILTELLTELSLL